MGKLSAGSRESGRIHTAWVAFAPLPRRGRSGPPEGKEAASPFPLPGRVGACSGAAVPLPLTQRKEGGRGFLYGAPHERCLGFGRRDEWERRVK